MPLSPSSLRPKLVGNSYCGASRQWTDFRCDVESLNSMQSCVLPCRCVDLSEGKPSRIPRGAYAPQALLLWLSGLVPDAEQESALKHTWVSASEGENGLTCATWQHRSISASREDPAPGAAQTAHRWVGIREGRGPAVLTAQREGFRSPLLTCSGLRTLCRTQ